MRCANQRSTRSCGCGSTNQGTTVIAFNGGNLRTISTDELQSYFLVPTSLVEQEEENGCTCGCRHTCCCTHTCGCHDADACGCDW